MEDSDLLEDIDKLSRILASPDPDDTNLNDDDSTHEPYCQGNVEESNQAPMHATSLLQQGASQSSALPGDVSLKLNSSEPGTKCTGFVAQQDDIDGSSAPSDGKDDSFPLHQSDDEPMNEQGNCCRASQDTHPTDTHQLLPIKSPSLVRPALHPASPIIDTFEESLQEQSAEIPAPLPLLETMPPSSPETMPPPPPPPDDLLQDASFPQKPCEPDFDAPCAVMDVDSCASDMNQVPVSAVSVTSGPHGIAAGHVIETRQLGSLERDVDRLSEILDIPDWNGSTHTGEGENSQSQWRSDSAPVASVESSALQGDINKLSRVLEEDSVATPMQLGHEVGGPMAPSPHSAPSTARSRGVSRQPSVVSSSGAQQSSALGDEILSQDDFLDDTFIGQDIPVNLENCLALNAAYQEVIDENLADLEQLLRQNQAQQAELKTLLNSNPVSEKSILEKSLLDSQKNRPARWNWYNFVVDHFADADGFGPLANADTREKMADEQYANMRWSHRWLQSERENLFEAVLGEARQRYFRMAQHHASAVRTTLRQLEVSTQTEEAESALAVLRRQLDEADQLLADAAQTPIMEIVTQMDDEYDWQKISQLVLGGKRTAVACRLQWCNFVRPTISHADWTPEEDERVLSAASNHQSKDPWQEVADELGRTAFQVFQRHAAVLTVPTKALWTKSEVDLLVQTIEDVRMGNFINWNEVALRLPNRNGRQCCSRYHAMCKEKIQKRGRFTMDEDMRIIAAFEVAGITNFKEMCAFLPGRSVAQLNKRYTRYLSPNVSRADWTRQEDEQLVRFVCENGPQWTLAAAQLGKGRNDDMCRNRFINIESAFLRHGRVPDTGTLAGVKHRSIDYYADVRDQLELHLNRLKPQDEADDTKARRKAAMAFVKEDAEERKRIFVGESQRKRQRFAEENVKVRRRARNFQWKSIAEILGSEGKSPYARAVSPSSDAEAAAVTARAWCLPSPGLERLQDCVDAGAPLTSFDVGALTEWSRTLSSDAAFPQHEYNWRRMPLVPASFGSCGAFRSLLMQRPRLEHCAALTRGHLYARARKLGDFNVDLAKWAEEAMSGARSDAGAGNPWVSQAAKHHHDRMVRVRVTEQAKGCAPRQFYMTVSAAEASNHQELVKRIVRQVPSTIKVDICRPQAGSGGEEAAVPGPPPSADAADAWHLLLARFVSMFFWPALLSLQPPPASVPDGVSPEEPSAADLVDYDFSGLQGPTLEDDTIWRLQEVVRRGPRCDPPEPPKAKRRKSK